MSIVIRQATEADQPVITALIREARINPRNLQWKNFLVAEDNGGIVGVRQVKQHQQGTREVASGYVVPEYRRQGISAKLMREIIARESGALYLLCDAKWAPYYERFGFERVARSLLPGDLHREYLIARTITTLLSILARRQLRIIPMRREP